MQRNGSQNESNRQQPTSSIMERDNPVRPTRRTFLTAAITTGVLGATNTVHAQEKRPIVLRATPDGWEAYQPVRYRGAVNPALLLWETHDIIWENTDGNPHGLVIESEAGEVIAQTEVVSTEGAIRSVRVSADLTDDSSPARYYCPEQPDTMAGTFHVAEYGAYVDGIATVTFTDGTSDGSTVTVDRVTFDLTAGFVAIYEGEPFEGLEPEEATRTYGEQSDDLFLGVSDSLHTGEHTDVEVPLETPLEPGEERTLAAIPYISYERDLEESTPYQEQYGFIYYDLATITVEDAPNGQYHQLTVTVEDTAGNPVEGAAVTIRGPEGEEQRDTDAEGSVTLDRLQGSNDEGPIAYTVTVAAEGFANAEETIELKEDEHLTITLEEESTAGSPQADFTYDPAEPRVGDEVTFEAVPSDTLETYKWDVTGNGTPDLSGETVTYTFEETGEYEVTLQVVDRQGNENSTQQTVSVGEATDGDTIPEWVPFAGATGIGFGAAGYLYGRTSSK